MTSDASVEVRHDGHVAIVTLNRPEARNAVDAAMHRRLASVWTELNSEPDVRAVILTGAGGSFCAGGDIVLISALRDDPAERTANLHEAEEIARSLANVEVPVVAAVSGPAIGLGASMVSLCDYVVLGEGAFLADPHVALGLTAGDGGGISWPLLIGLLRAKSYILLGERIDARTAVTLGLANLVVDDDRVLDEALAIAARFASLAPLATRSTKRLLQRGLRAAMDRDLALALADEWHSFDTPELGANLAEFLSKRRASDAGHNTGSH